MLLVGPKGGGKTMLTLRLIRAGYEIEGDENVFVTSEGVVPRPRGLRVKESAAALLPHLAETFERRPLLPGRPELASLQPRSPSSRSRVLAYRAGASGCGRALAPQSRGFFVLAARLLPGPRARGDGGMRAARNRARRSGRGHNPSHWQCKRI